MNGGDGRAPQGEAMHADALQISQAESRVMEALWTRSPQSAEALVAALAVPNGWQEATVKTLLNRLLRKGVVTAEKDGRRYLYAPVPSREEWLGNESEGLLDRLFGGRVVPLIAHFSRRGRLSPSDVAELRRLIEELDEGR